jgi:C4-dicarboxylate-specific signal transduction histidine kinase
MIRRDNSSRISSRTGVPPPGDGQREFAACSHRVAAHGREIRRVVDASLRLALSSVTLNAALLFFCLAVVYQKRLKKERRARKRLQEQLDLEIKRRTQLEEALKATGASSEQVRAITGT